MMFGILRKPDPGVIAAGGKPRSPKWPAWLKAFLRGKRCAVCGAIDNLTGHHVVPFHVAPERELDESNVAPVCDGDCHFLVGHLKDWRTWNTAFWGDAEQFYAKRVAAQGALKRG